MTIRNEMHQRLTERVVWPHEADQILDSVEQSIAMQSMQGRWNHDISDYSAELVSLTWFTVKTMAIEWLTFNKPNHFAINVLQGT